MLYSVYLYDNALVQYILNFCWTGIFLCIFTVNGQNFEYIINYIFRYTKKKHVQTKYVQTRGPEITGVLRNFLVYYVK